MDNNISLFLDRLNSLIPEVQASDAPVSEEMIRQHFEGMELTDEHFERIYDYLQAHEIDVERTEEKAGYQSLDMDDLTIPEGVSDDDPVHLYISEIGEYDVPSSAQKDEMISMIHTDMKLACELIAPAYQRMVYAIAKQKVGRGVLIMDLVQEGNMGLLSGVASYNNGDFDQYLYEKINEAMEDVISEYSREDQVPQYVADTMNKIRTIQEILSETSDEDPDIRDIARELDIPVERAQEILRLAKEEE